VRTARGALSIVGRAGRLAGGGWRRLGAVGLAHPGRRDARQEERQNGHGQNTHALSQDSHLDTRAGYRPEQAQA